MSSTPKKHKDKHAVDHDECATSQGQSSESPSSMNRSIQTSAPQSSTATTMSPPSWSLGSTNMGNIGALADPFVLEPQPGTFLDSNFGGIPSGLRFGNIWGAVPHDLPFGSNAVTIPPGLPFGNDLGGIPHLMHYGNNLGQFAPGGSVEHNSGNLPGLHFGNNLGIPPVRMTRHNFTYPNMENNEVLSDQISLADSASQRGNEDNNFTRLLSGSAVATVVAEHNAAVAATLLPANSVATNGGEDGHDLPVKLLPTIPEEEMETNTTDADSGEDLPTDSDAPDEKEGQDDLEDEAEAGAEENDVETTAEFKVRLTYWLEQMMFVSGETAEPSAETTWMIEEIVREQVLEMVGH